jgi:hypothetical protein
VHKRVPQRGVVRGLTGRGARCVHVCTSIADHVVAVQNVYQTTDALARLVLYVTRAQAEALTQAHANAGSGGAARPLVRRLDGAAS